VAFYRAFIHPLRKYPGPKLAAISRVPYLWNAYNGDLVRWVDRVHQKHGPIVRIAPYELSFTNPQAWKDIYGHATGGKKMLQKDLRFYNFKVLGRVADIVRSNDTNHARFRRNFSYAFSERALKAQEPLVAKYADLLVAKMNQIAESPGSKADIVRWYNFATFDIMSDLTFGDPLGQLESSEYNEFVTLVFDSVKTNMMAMITRYLPALQPLASILISKEAFEKRERHFRGCIDRVDKRLAKDNTRPDIWGLVMKETGETKLTLDEMYANSNSFMIGGTETTATLLSGLTYQLLQHPHIMEKLTNEIREAFPSDEEITLNNLTRVTYMHACIEEGFRLYPPVPGGLPRWTPPEGAVICDEVIPGNVRNARARY
jgi:cytochrome P450